MAAAPFGDLVIVIPGILGSRLVRREGTQSKTVWDFSIKGLPRTLKALATDALVLASHNGPPDDGIEAVELFSFQWLPDFFGVDDYMPLLKALRASIAGKAEQLLTFPYDWRASNQYAAERLQERALPALELWRRASGNASAKLWLVCHSMGGLVARYFCEHLGGAAHTRAIITIGTPHRGSVKALDALANGKAFWPLNLTRLVRSLPSAYELLPLFPAIRVAAEAQFGLHRIADFFGLDAVSGEAIAATATRGMPSLPGIDPAILQRALRFHACIRAPAEARQQRGEPTSYEQRAFVNRLQRTSLSAHLDGENLQILEHYPIGPDQWVDHRGDGTVPSFASVPIEWPDSKEGIPIGDKHAAMQCAQRVLDDLDHWLRPQDLRELKGGRNEAVVELSVPPALARGQDLVVSVAALRPTNLYVRLEDADGRLRQMLPLSLPGDDARRLITFRCPEPGVFRVIARPADLMLGSVSDLVLVPESE